MLKVSSETEDRGAFKKDKVLVVEASPNILNPSVLTLMSELKNSATKGTLVMWEQGNRSDAAPFYTQMKNREIGIIFSYDLRRSNFPGST